MYVIGEIFVGLVVFSIIIQVLSAPLRALGTLVGILGMLIVIVTAVEISASVPSNFAVALGVLTSLGGFVAILFIAHKVQEAYWAHQGRIDRKK